MTLYWRYYQTFSFSAWFCESKLAIYVFNTHDTYSFPTVRKDLTLRLQFRFFNMNHRKPALIQWKVATRCVVDHQPNEPHFLSPYGEGLTNANAIFASLTQLFRQIAPREKHTIAQTRSRKEYSSDRLRNKARTERWFCICVIPSYTFLETDSSDSISTSYFRKSCDREYKCK